MTYHMILEWLEQHLQKTLRREQGSLIELFLPKVKVVVHWLHQGTQEVNRCMTDSIVLPLQSFHNFAAHHLPKAKRSKGGREGSPKL